MVCICVHTPDDDPFKDTHCVLGLDDNGKVDACGWNHLQRGDQFLFSFMMKYNITMFDSRNFEKIYLNLINYFYFFLQTYFIYLSLL